MRCRAVHPETEGDENDVWETEFPFCIMKNFFLKLIFPGVI